MADTDSNTSVYRYYDLAGVLIYVGVTATGIERNRQHNANKAWWPFVASQEVEHYKTRAAALERERKLISQHHPPFNTVHNPDAAGMREAYRLFRESGVCERAPVDIWRANHRLLPLTLIGGDASDGNCHFRTRLEDFPLASIVEVPLLCPVTFGALPTGQLTIAERTGPFVVIKVTSVRRGWTIQSAKLLVKLTPTKPPVFVAKRLLIAATKLPSVEGK